MRQWFTMGLQWEHSNIFYRLEATGAGTLRQAAMIRRGASGAASVPASAGGFRLGALFGLSGADETV
jgi:hypothetical protein